MAEPFRATRHRPLQTTYLLRAREGSRASGCTVFYRPPGVTRDRMSCYDRCPAQNRPSEGFWDTGNADVAQLAMVRPRPNFTSNVSRKVALASNRFSYTCPHADMGFSTAEDYRITLSHPTSSTVTTSTSGYLDDLTTGRCFSSLLFNATPLRSTKVPC